MSATLAQNPKIVSVELGGNEVLGARSGIYIPAGTVEKPAGTVERTEVFKELYAQLLDAVESTAKHAVLIGMVDDAMDFPSFRTGQEIWDARATFAPFNVVVSEDCGTVNSANVLFVAARVPAAVAQGAARKQAEKGPYPLSCANAPSSTGIQDFVLSAEEVAALNAQVAEMDAFIRSEGARILADAAAKALNERYNLGIPLSSSATILASR